MARHLLSDRHVKAAKPRKHPYRLADGDGLYLYVPPSGVFAWQFRYRLDGKQLTATLGRADLLSLGEAREAALLARKRVAEGQHLTVLKRVQTERGDRGGVLMIENPEDATLFAQPVIAVACESQTVDGDIAA